MKPPVWGLLLTGLLNYCLIDAINMGVTQRLEEPHDVTSQYVYIAIL